MTHRIRWVPRPTFNVQGRNVLRLHQATTAATPKGERALANAVDQRAEMIAEVKGTEDLM